MSTHCVSIIKNSNLSLKMKKEDYEVIKDQPIKIFDWSSILSSSKNEDSSHKFNSTSLYIHPLDKRSRNSLSEKSLEICTESLGSETGSGSDSDCFLSSPISEHEDSDDDKDNHHYYHQQQYHVVSESFEDFHVYNHSKRLISSKSFPPSLPSIHMQSHRQNGRLILEAASISPNNSLHAQRLDGHLLLTFINQNNYEHEIEKREDEVEEFEKMFNDIQEVEGKEILHSDSGDGDEEESKGEEDEEEEEEEKKTMMEQSPRLSSEVTNVNKASIMILEKKNQLTWSKHTVSFNTTSGYIDFNNRFNNSVNLLTQQERNSNKLRECYTQSPSPSPSPSPTTATSLNAYEYFWRKKPTMANIVNNSTITKYYYYYYNKQVGVATTTNGIDTTTTSTKKLATCTQDLVLIKENKASIMNNKLGPLLRSCKEPKSSLIIWEPYCIPTS